MKDHEAIDFNGPESIAKTVVASGDELKKMESGVAPKSGPRLRVARPAEHGVDEQKEVLGESVADFLASFIPAGEGAPVTEYRRAMEVALEDLKGLLFRGADTVTLDERASGYLHLTLQQGVLKKDQATIVAVANYINNLVMLRMMSERG